MAPAFWKYPVPISAGEATKRMSSSMRVRYADADHAPRPARPSQRPRTPASTDLRRVGEYLGEGFPRGIAAGGPLVFVADQPAGLMLVDVSSPAAPAVAGTLSLGRDPVTQVIAPDPRSTGGALPGVVCIVSGRGGLQAVDVSDPAAPRVSAAIPTAGRLAGAAMWDRRVYAASGGVLQVFDLTDPGRPTLAGTSELGGQAGAVAVNDDLVFVATAEDVVIFRRR